MVCVDDLNYSDWPADVPGFVKGDKVLALKWQFVKARVHEKTDFFLIYLYTSAFANCH